jgi:hypothetical protein
MNLDRNILKLFCRTAICIISMLILSIGFSFGGALASNCQGGAGCLVCAELPHGHVAGRTADMQNPGCTPGGQNGSCGFEAHQDPDEFHGIVSSVRSYNPVNTGIFTAASNGTVPSLLTGEFISKFVLSDSDGAVPLYLQNQSLLR